MDKIIDILQISFYEILLTIGVIFITGIIIKFFKQTTLRNLRNSFGKNAIFITSLFGVPIHETGHAIMCIIFGHKIKEIQFFNLKNNSTTLGYVKNSYNKNNLYHKIGILFIALGPIFSGIIVLLILLKILLPEAFDIFINYKLVHFNFDISYLKELYIMSKEIILSIFTLENIKSYKFWIFIFVAISISTHMSLSKKDLSNFWHGFITLIIVLLVFNSILILFLLIEKPTIMEYLNVINMYIVSTTVMAIIFSFISLVFTSILNLIFGRK